MELREALDGVRGLGYVHTRDATQPAQRHLQQVEKGVEHVLPAGLRVRSSGRGQSLPMVPWIAVLDPDVTQTAHKGLYVVYLYRQDLSRVFLSMNQGATQHLDDAKARGLKGGAAELAAIGELTNESRLLRASLSEELLVGLDTPVKLGARRFLPEAYEAGNIVAVEYNTASLPAESALRADLERFLALYQSCVEAKREILAASPGTIRTAATAEAPPSRAVRKPPVFRPKNSAEYVATVRAQKQVRYRRHERLVERFGNWVKKAGAIPATNVHPRDLTVTGGGREWLVEAKIVGTNAELAVRDAIGQLYAYRHFYYREKSQSDPLLVALFSEPVGNAFLPLLGSLGIEAIWPQAGAWRTSATHEDGLIHYLLNSTSLGR
jgi:MrcB-like, N-terminal domain